MGNTLTYEDYEILNSEIRGLGYNININPDNVDQVWLTDVLLKHGVSLSLFGHDHIFHDKAVKGHGHEMNAIFGGAAKYASERSWWERNPLWKRFFGDWGGYGLEATGNCDFWGAGGITKITVGKEGINVKYIRTANNSLKTNIPDWYKTGDVLEEIGIEKRKSELTILRIFINSDFIILKISISVKIKNIFFQISHTIIDYDSDVYILIEQDEDGWFIS